VKIGELAQRTGISHRMLRYYEQQGLIAPQRLDNGYRDYDEDLVDRAEKIRCFLDAGVPMRALAPVLDHLEQSPDVRAAITFADLRARLLREHDRMGERIESLQRNREALSALIETLGDRPGDTRSEAAVGSISC
jgi:DNA-binding transcriptional MerR regulator